MFKNKIDAQFVSSISKLHVPDAKCQAMNVLPFRVSACTISISIVSSNGLRKGALMNARLIEKNGHQGIDFLTCFNLCESLLIKICKKIAKIK